jgi:hypothetical protein
VRERSGCPKSLRRLQLLGFHFHEARCDRARIYKETLQVLNCVRTVPAEYVRSLYVMTANSSSKVRKIQSESAAAIQQVCNQSVKEGTMSTEDMLKILGLIVTSTQVQRHPCVFANSVSESLDCFSQKAVFPVL